MTVVWRHYAQPENLLITLLSEPQRLPPILGITVKHLHTLAKEPDFPAKIKLGSHAVGWRVLDLENWIDSKKRQPDANHRRTKRMFSEAMENRGWLGRAGGCGKYFQLIQIQKHLWSPIHLARRVITSMISWRSSRLFQRRLMAYHAARLTVSPCSI